MGHIILVIANAASPTTGDLIIEDHLETAGHTVTRQSDEAAEYSDPYDGVVIADSSSGVTIGTKYDTATVPGITLENSGWRLGTYLGGISSVTSWTVEDVEGNGGLTGGQTVYDAAQSQQGIDTDTLPAGAIVVARATGDADHGTYVLYEEGGDLAEGTAPARRVFLRIADGALDNLTTAGLTLLDAAIEWSFGVPAVTGVATVALGALDVTVVAGPQLRTGTVAVTPGGVNVTATGLRIISGTASVTPGALSVYVAGAAVPGTAAVDLGALSVTATGTVIPPVPAAVLDLSYWHLTTSNDSGEGDAEQIDQPELDTYTDENFYVDEQSRVVCSAPVNGFTTSGASGATRYELRQRRKGTYALAAIDPYGVGRWQMTGTSYVDATSITGGTAPRKEGIFAQIHGAGSSPIPLILAAEYHVATPRVRIFKNGPGFDNPVTGITPTTAISYRIRIENSRLKLWVIAGLHTDLPPVTSTAPYDWPISDFTDDEDWYYKDGAYNKTLISSGSTGQFVSKIAHLEILEPSDPDPSGAVFGTASVSGGALNVAAAGRRIVRGTVSVAGPALSVAATGTVVAEVVAGTAALLLGALVVAAAGTRVVPGTAAVPLGALSVLAVGKQTVTGAAAVSLGPLSVTAVGAVVAEVVTGTAHVAIAGLTITASGSRATIGTAAVTLPALVVVAVGAAQRTQVSAGTPTPVPGPVGFPAVVHGPVADTPIAR